MFLLVRRLLKLGVFMIDKLLWLIQSIHGNFLLLDLVPYCCFAELNLVVYTGL